MFKSLRLHLAMLYCVLAGVVLMIVALSCLGVAKTHLRLAAQTAFESSVNAVVYKLQSDRTLSQSWLSQIEAGERQMIYIEDGDAPLAFQGAYTPKTPRETLIERALLIAEDSGLTLPLGSLSPVSSYFQISGEAGDQYLGCVTLLPVSSKKPLRLAMLRDQTEANARLTRQQNLVLLISIAGLLALFIGGWFYSGHALRPIEANNARQTEFTAMAAHELKAPLAVVSAGVDALSTLCQAEGQKALCQTLSAETLRMARLVDDLLLLARSDAGQWRLRAEKVDLDTLMIECYELFLPLAASKKQRLTVTLPDEPLPSLRGDEGRLRQLLTILLDNAVSYTGEGGRITLSACVSGNHARISVEDDGPGIKSSEAAKIFDRFYRADASHHDRSHAGLGLSIARELTRLHGGRIFVEEARPHGARFVVLLPV